MTTETMIKGDSTIFGACSLPLSIVLMYLSPNPNPNPKSSNGDEGGTNLSCLLLTLHLPVMPRCCQHWLRSACEHATMPSYSRLPAGTVYVSTAAAAATAVVAADSISVRVPQPRHSEVYDG